jgi:ubiquinol-cytochrome c reductase cytochrome c1 subunit
MFLQTFRSQKQNIFWFGKALAGSAIGGVAISELFLTTERMNELEDTLENTKKSIQTEFGKYGISLFGDAMAFSTADHGLHPAHHPWEFNKIYKTFDHAAY